MTTLLAGVYFLCGISVVLALQDDDFPSELSGIFLTLVLAAIWPCLFMYSLTAALRQHGGVFFKAPDQPSLLKPSEKNK